MTLLAPGWLIVAAVASLAVAALHLIAWRTPRREVLPTARFVPDDPARRAARTVLLSDVGLLALRVGILLLAGLALARPGFDTARRGTGLVVAIDATVDSAAVSGVLAMLPRADRTAYVVFDTMSTVASDSGAVLVGLSRSGAPVSSLSVGLLAATREALRLEQDVESVGLVLVSPLSVASLDGATTSVRALWPDSIHVVRVARRAGTVPGPVSLPDDGDDPIVAGARLASANRLLSGPITLVRDTAVVPDARALVVWPRISGDAASRVDGVLAGTTAAVGHFLRLPDAGGPGRVIARWIDGTPAAREVQQNDGCTRRVYFDVPDEGDFTLTPAFQRLLAVLLQPCTGDAIAHQLAADSVVRALASSPLGDSPVVAAADTPGANRLAAVLMGLAIAALLVEWIARRRGGATLLAEQSA